MRLNVFFHGTENQQLFSGAPRPILQPSLQACCCHGDPKPFSYKCPCRVSGAISVLFSQDGNILQILENQASTSCQPLHRNNQTGQMHSEKLRVITGLPLPSVWEQWPGGGCERMLKYTALRKVEGGLTRTGNQFPPLYCLSSKQIPQKVSRDLSPMASLTFFPTRCQARELRLHWPLLLLTQPDMPSYWCFPSDLLLYREQFLFPPQTLVRMSPSQ